MTYNKEDILSLARMCKALYKDKKIGYTLGEWTVIARKIDKSSGYAGFLLKRREKDTKGGRRVFSFVHRGSSLNSILDFISDISSVLQVSENIPPMQYQYANDFVKKNLHSISEKDEVIQTGHSLGGALAKLCCLDSDINLNKQIAITFNSLGVADILDKIASNSRESSILSYYTKDDISEAIGSPVQNQRIESLSNNKTYKTAPKFFIHILQFLRVPQKILNIVNDVSVQKKKHSIANIIYCINSLPSDYKTDFN